MLFASGILRCLVIVHKSWLIQEPHIKPFRDNEVSSCCTWSVVCDQSTFSDGCWPHSAVVCYGHAMAAMAMGCAGHVLWWLLWPSDGCWPRSVVVCHGRLMAAGHILWWFAMAMWWSAMAMWCAGHVLWWFAMATAIVTAPLPCSGSSRVVLRAWWALVQLPIGSVNLEGVSTQSTWPGCSEAYGDLRKFQVCVRWCSCHPYFLLILRGGSGLTRQFILPVLLQT